jgi:hypothetical protein
MAETIDFKQVAQWMEEAAREIYAGEDTSPETIADVIQRHGREALRLAWKARGAADIVMIEHDLS